MLHYVVLCGVAWQKSVTTSDLKALKKLLALQKLTVVPFKDMSLVCVSKVVVEALGCSLLT